MIPHLTKGERVVAWLGLKLLRLFGYSIEEAEGLGISPRTMQIMRDYQLVKECERNDKEA